MPTQELIRSEKFKGWAVRLTLQDGTVFRSSNFRRENLTDSARVIDVDMQFDLKWNAIPPLPMGDIAIKNVQIDPALKFKRGDLMTLQAGWAPDQQNDTVSLLLSIEDIEMETRGRGRTTMYLSVGDGLYPLLVRGASKGWRPGTNAETVFRDLIQIASMSPGKISPPKSYTYTKGFAVWGPIWHAFRQVARDQDSVFTYWGDEINLMPPDEGIRSDFKLSPENGVLVDSQLLAGIPQDEQLRVLLRDFERPSYRLTSMLTSKIFPNAVYDVLAPEISDETMTVRAIRGRYFNDGTVQRVENDVVPVTDDGFASIFRKIPFL